MYTHAKLRDFEGRLAALFAEADRRLEDRWGDAFPRHPNRPPRGTSEDPGLDGLFDTAADFTAGIGSERGRGYLVSIRVATLRRVPPERRDAFVEEAVGTLRELLPRYFPERALEVVRDGESYKIVGDFSLGEA